MADFCFSQASEEVMELATNFVEKYIDYIENLPFDLQRSVTRLREIDCTCREILSEIEELYGSFTKETDAGINLKKRTTLIKIQHLFGRCQELGDEKISIVQQITESIESRKKAVENANYHFTAAYQPDRLNDFNRKREYGKSDYHKASKRSRRHRPMYQGKQEKEKLHYAGYVPISSLSNTNINDNSSRKNNASSGEKPSLKASLENLNTKESSMVSKKIEKFEKKKISLGSNSDNKSTTSASSTASSIKTPVSTKTTSKTPISSNKLSSTSSNGANKSASKTKKKKKKVMKNSDQASRSPSPQANLTIDPDEPTYCLCDQVSFGQMIGCDNKKCPIEWFHFSCVGLSYKPKGKWYCPDCLREMKDKKKDNKKENR